MRLKPISPLTMLRAQVVGANRGIIANLNKVGEPAFC
jgi:hypothetical protein